MSNLERIEAVSTAPILEARGQESGDSKIQPTRSATISRREPDRFPRTPPFVPAPTSCLEILAYQVQPAFRPLRTSAFLLVPLRQKYSVHEALTGPFLTVEHKAVGLPLPHAYFLSTRTRISLHTFHDVRSVDPIFLWYGPTRSLIESHQRKRKGYT
jgi:hypothetical protein